MLTTVMMLPTYGAYVATREAVQHRMTMNPMAAAVLLLMPLFVQAAEGPTNPATMDQLIEDSKAGKMLSDSAAFQKNRVAKADVPKLKSYIRRHPDFRSYQCLLALCRDFPEAFKAIPVEVRAAVLCSALKNAPFLNDWGELGAPAEFYLDYEPAKALLDIGYPAIPFLRPLLDDPNPATLEGSEEATHSEECQYRRCDWACQFISLILEVPYRFSESPAERDKGIALLKSSLKADATMFPDGRYHDFGTGMPDPCIKYAFRIVNTSDAPLRIVRWRCPTCSSPMRPEGSVTKEVLQPNETGKLEVSIDTTRFLGSRTASCFLEIEQRGIIEEFVFTVTANASWDE